VFISIASYSLHAITYNYLYPNLFGSLTARKQELDDKVLVEIEVAVHDAETEDALNVPTLPVTNKRMPKTSKKFGWGKTRGGDRKVARAARVPQVVTTKVIGSNPPSSSNTSVPKKKITKLQLSKQLTKSMNKRKQSEEKDERAQKKLAIATANCKTLAALAQERRKIIVATCTIAFVFHILLDHHRTNALVGIKYIQACTSQLGREVDGASH
jgi:hypothetical protein